jgi:pimeloyl-ACP methyl ester carboxylesterase
LHGYLACKETFNYQIEYLSRYFKVTAFDFLGFGKSGCLDKPFDVTDYTNLTVKILDELGIKKASFIAHSFGGRVAIKLATINPECINKLLLTGCAGLKPKFSIKKKIKIYLFKFFKLFLSKEKLEKKFGSSDYKNLSPVMKQSFVKIISEDLSSQIKNIKVPTLLIFGENDKETPLYMAKKLKKGIKNSELIVFKNTGHFAFIDNSLKFNIIAKSFFK